MSRESTALYNKKHYTTSQTLGGVTATYARRNLEGHKPYCTGLPRLSIRMQEGRYRIVRGCECGSVREIAPSGYETYGAAEAVLGAGWWR